MLLNSPPASPSMTPESYRQARQTLDQLRQELLDQRNDRGHWVGRLSASALSTATAVSAMSVMLDRGAGSVKQRAAWKDCVERGIEYLRTQQNRDGGYGDTDRSYSNIATSYLALAAASLAKQAVGESFAAESVTRLERYLDDAGGIPGLRQRYGTDKTFVIPILTNMAIAGLVPWREITPLPFEAAVFPQSMYRWLQMPVVSYAIPALVAIGQARHFLGPRSIWPIRQIRSASVSRTMDVLGRMQPESGGYLEATPLTSFVVMSLAATGRADHDVCQRGMRFLVDSMDEDGSWPIDTNLATWVTSLSVHALTRDPDDDGVWCRESLVRWHLGCQHQQRHPFTGAEPGGWGWTDLSGAVPDSDDTPAAIIATTHFMRHVDGDLYQRCAQAIDQGLSWLRRLQNRDGGWPTFCRGWGKLPFDRSSNDLTAHVIRAVEATGGDPGKRRGGDNRVNVAKGVRFLHRNQRADGSWLPLWFGNQDTDDEINPVYGTSRVLVAGAGGSLDSQSITRGCEFLVRAQNSDGGWGGGAGVAAWIDQRDLADRPDSSSGGGNSPVLGTDRPERSSVEETALALDGLLAVVESQRNHLPNGGVQTACDGGKSSSGGSDLPLGAAGPGNIAIREAIIRGVEFLVDSVRRGDHRDPWPIGFYFAKLWYHEELYPLIFATTALGNLMRTIRDPMISDWLGDR